jgi:hypothetical protein
MKFLCSVKSPGISASQISLTSPSSSITDFRLYGVPLDVQYFNL